MQPQRRITSVMLMRVMTNLALTTPRRFEKSICDNNTQQKKQSNLVTNPNCSSLNTETSLYAVKWKKSKSKKLCLKEIKAFNFGLI